MTAQNKLASSARITGFGTIIRTCIQLLQLTVLSRVLTPSDFGLIALVYVFIGYASLLNDFGISSAIIAKKEISDCEKSSLYCFSVLISLVLASFLIILSPAIAALYGESDLSTMIAFMSMIFVINSLGQQLRVLAEKELKFIPIVLIEITSAIFTFVAAVFLSWYEFGAMALVLASILGALVSLTLSWLLLSNGWMPSIRLKLNEVRWYLGFGSSLIVNNIINQFNSTFDIIIGNYLLGKEAVGLYSLPRNVSLQIQGVINPIFTRISFPILSKVREEPIIAKVLYLKTMLYCSCINSPIYVFLFIFSGEAVEIMFGERWSEFGLIMKYLCVWSFFRSLMNPAGSLLFAFNRTKLAIKWNVVQLLILPLVLSVGSYWGIHGVAATQALLMIILLYPSWYILVRSTIGGTFVEFIFSFFRPLLFSVSVGLLTYLVVQQIGDMVIRFICGGVIFLLLYVAMLCIFFSEIRAYFLLHVRRHFNWNL